MGLALAFVALILVTAVLLGSHLVREHDAA